MASETMDLQESTENVFPKIQHAIGSSDYKIKTIDVNKSIIAEGKRDFSWAAVIVLAILIWPAALVYYFTRQRSSVTVIATTNTTSGCRVTINSNGKSGEAVLRTIADALQ